MLFNSIEPKLYLLLHEPGLYSTNGSRSTFQGRSLVVMNINIYNTNRAKLSPLSFLEVFDITLLHIMLKRDISETKMFDAEKLL
jgi:hypothetical protein